jgi:fatty acid desaturase
MLVREKGTESARFPVPSGLNLFLCSGVLVIYGAFFAAARLLSSGHASEFAPLLAAFILSTPTAWGLVHEGIHGRLLRHRAGNLAISRMVCILLGFSFEVVQFGHLMHHRYNGYEHDRPDRIDPSRPLWMSWLKHYGHLLGGHWLFTCLVSVVAFLPDRLRTVLIERGFPGTDTDVAAIRRAALKWCGHRDRIVRIRVDCLLSLVLGTLYVWQYGAHWPVLLGALYGRALMYSMLDNLPHYGTRERGNAAAKNLSLAGWASFLVLNHNLHRVHHERPDVPWRAVPSCFSGAMDGGYMQAALSQFRGPLP